MKIAVCNDIQEFGGNRLNDRRWATRFPGAGWVCALNEHAIARGWEVASGDVALSHIQCGYWHASDVVVIQELDSAWGARLIAAGCRPLLLTCFESPLYAGLFFDRLQEYVAVFQNYMGPWVEKHPREGTGSVRYWPLRFPCYWATARETTKEWSTRREEVVLVASNKYWQHEDHSSKPSLISVRSYLNWMRHRYALWCSPSLARAKQRELHDARLRAILALSRARVLEIYGSGWDNLTILPPLWQRRLAGTQLRYRGKVDDKLALQSRFRFALCCENISYPGYVTEKIFDAFVAGTIPVYLGAPDITDHVPVGTFVDASTLSSMAQLPDLLRSIPKNTALEMVAGGRQFLDSEEGYAHSYEGFARWVVNLLLEQVHAV